ncbi:hypothetical protein [Marivirga sp.]|uniref:hypothetical protein n=1 Tax=Marivirga sp. TaxID=2018662 RepID=UPI003DA78884
MENIKKKAAEEWLKKAVPLIQQRISKLDVKDSGELFRSIKGSVEELSGGDTYKATIAYQYYGIFPHYGVGNGVEKGEGAAAKLAGSQRKRKPWLKSVSREAYTFQEILTSKFADDAQIKLSKGTKGNNKINLKF